jgi:hypothetical protein
MSLVGQGRKVPCDQREEKEEGAARPLSWAPYTRSLSCVAASNPQLGLLLGPFPRLRRPPAPLQLASRIVLRFSDQTDGISRSASSSWMAGSTAAAIAAPCSPSPCASTESTASSGRSPRGSWRCLLDPSEPWRRPAFGSAPARGALNKAMGRSSDGRHTLLAAPIRRTLLS